MTEIVIAKGIPIPTVVRRRPGGPSLYPWRTIDVGESFLFPAAVLYTREVTRVANQRYAPKQFVARTVEGGRVRCWRVK